MTIRADGSFNSAAFLRPRVFISWSGARAEAAARILAKWLEEVICTVRPFVSSRDILPGHQWLRDLSDELEQSSMGIICLTPENLTAPWIMFEAGAIAKTLDASVLCPFLVGVTSDDLVGPLQHFQAVLANKEGTSKLVGSINEAVARGLGESWRIRDEVLNASVERNWDRLNQALCEVCPNVATHLLNSDERVRGLVNSLESICKSCPSPHGRPVIRYSGFLSSFAIRDEDELPPSPGQERYTLRNERDLLIAAAKQGHAIRCIISPPCLEGGEHPVHVLAAHARRRLEGLIAFLKDERSKRALRNIEWAISPFRQPTLFIFDLRESFLGIKKDFERGSELTIHETDHNVIRAEVRNYDALWTHLKESGNKCIGPQNIGQLLAILEACLQACKEGQVEHSDSAQPSEGGG